MKTDAYQVVTDRILGLLEEGVVPWQKPWNGGESAPRNLVSKREYRGVNVFLLHAMMFESPFWLTFKQAHSLGGHVKKGEKACPVVFWKWLEVDDKNTGARPGETNTKAKRVPMLRCYSVFNVTQCDGLEGKIPVVAWEPREHDTVEAAERILLGMPKAPTVKTGQAAAFYRPADDQVGMPSLERFDTAEDYYSTLFHELTHSTGHVSRLNRKGCSGVEGQWSKFDYGATAAASMAYLMQQQQDAVGLITFNTKVELNLPHSASPSHLRLLFHEM